MIITNMYIFRAIFVFENETGVIERKERERKERNAKGNYTPALSVWP